MIDKLNILYQYLYRETFKVPKYRFRPNDASIKLMETFVSKLDYSVGDGWLYDYVCYQFQRVKDFESKFYGARTMPAWIFGQKALKRYREASYEEKSYTEKFKADLGLRNPLYKTGKIDLRNLFENERSRFYGTYKGLVHCLSLELFDVKSEFCNRCMHKSVCDEETDDRKV